MENNSSEKLSNDHWVSETIEDQNSSDDDKNKSNEPKTVVWGSKWEFLCSCIAMSVGLGNIWRFPYIAYVNGGGAFLIPYLILLILFGKPLYLYELILGQFNSKGSVMAGTVLPILRGVTIGQQMNIALSLVYYVPVVTLALFYTVKSFYSTLPWSYCWDEWNDGSVHCVPADPKLNASENLNNLTSQSSSELYFIREVIKQKDQIDDGIGLPDLQLTIFFLVVWVIVYMVIIRGVRSSGKASYFLALFPYVILVTLLIRSLLLDGAWEGIKYFIVPDFSMVLKPRVWYAATTQLFYSLSVGSGTMMNFASYNKFDHDIYRDALIVTSMDTLTSLMAGFTIFGTLGNLAFNINEKDVGKVIKSGGFGLAFISYPEAIAKFKSYPQVFSVIFFLMLTTLGVGTAMGLVTAIVTNFRDFFHKNLKLWQLSLLTCIVSFFIGLVFITPGGQWVSAIIDNCTVGLGFVNTILFISFIIWIYGLENFCWDTEFMLKWKPTRFWRICWGIVTPGLLIAIFIYEMTEFQVPTYMDKNYPLEAYIVWAFIYIVGSIQILIWGTFIFLRSEDKKKTLKGFFKLNPAWGPKSPKNKEDWKEYKKEKKEKRKVQSVNHSKVKKVAWILWGKYY